MKPTFLSIGLIVSSLMAFSQDTITELSTKFYASTNNYRDKTLDDENLIAIASYIGEDFIRVDKLINADTREKSKRGAQAWAIQYNDATYFNLLHSYDLKSQDIFVRLDIEGRYCLGIIDHEELKKLNNTRLLYPTMGLTGGLASLLANESVTWAKGWRNAQGERKHILIVDTKHLTINIPKMGKNAAGDLLKKSTLQYLAGYTDLKGKPSDYTVEEIIRIIEILNAREK